MNIITRIKAWWRNLISTTTTNHRECEERHLRNAFYVVETNGHFYIMCNGIAVRTFLAGTKIDFVLTALEQHRKAAIEHCNDEKVR